MPLFVDVREFGVARTSNASFHCTTSSAKAELLLHDQIRSTPFLKSFYCTISFVALGSCKNLQELVIDSSHFILAIATAYFMSDSVRSVY